MNIDVYVNVCYIDFHAHHHLLCGKKKQKQKGKNKNKKLTY